MARRQWFDVPVTDSPLAASLLNDLEARKPEISFMSINIKEPPYNAVGNGIADDTLAIQTALDSLPYGGGEIRFPAGTYKITSPLSITRSGTKLRGAARWATLIVSSSSDVFTLAPVAVLNSLAFESMTIQSLAGGGHIFDNDSATGVSVSHWRDLQVAQFNAAKSIWHQTTGAYIDNLWDNCDLYHVTDSTVYSFNLSSTDSLINSNTWRRLRIQNNGLPFFNIECSMAGAWQWDNVFRDITAEVTIGGVIRARSCASLLMEQVNVYDLQVVGPTTGHQFDFGKTTLGPDSTNIRLRNCCRRYGALGGGLVDIMLTNASNVILDGCQGAGVGTVFTIDINSQPGVTLLGCEPSFVTVQNPTVDTTVLITSTGLVKIGDVTLSRGSFSSLAISNPVFCSAGIYAHQGGGGSDRL